MVLLLLDSKWRSVLDGCRFYAEIRELASEAGGQKQDQSRVPAARHCTLLMTTGIVVKQRSHCPKRMQVAVFLSLCGVTRCWLAIPAGQWMTSLH
jgi:hypothetical protein